jgi:hypothetical protein
LRPQFAFRIAALWPLEMFNHNECWRCALFWVSSCLFVWVIAPYILVDGYRLYNIMSDVFLRDAVRRSSFSFLCTSIIKYWVNL